MWWSGQAAMQEPAAVREAAAAGTYLGSSDEYDSCDEGKAPQRKETCL